MVQCLCPAGLSNQLPHYSWAEVIWKSHWFVHAPQLLRSTISNTGVESLQLYYAASTAPELRTEKPSYTYFYYWLSVSTKRRSNLSICGWGLLMFTYHYESTRLLTIKFRVLSSLFYHISNLSSDCACLFSYLKYLKMFGSRAFSINPVLCALIFMYKAVQYLIWVGEYMFSTLLELWVWVFFHYYAPKTLFLLMVGWFLSPSQKRTSRKVYKVVMRQENDTEQRLRKKGYINKITY